VPAPPDFDDSEDEEHPDNTAKHRKPRNADPRIMTFTPSKFLATTPPSPSPSPSTSTPTPTLDLDPDPDPRPRPSTSTPTLDLDSDLDSGVRLTTSNWWFDRDPAAM
jgi:hypothetical protein